MKKAFYIIIRGPLGIGKSTIAKELTKKLKATYISFDKVLEENGIDRGDDNFTPEDFIKANNIVLPIIKKDLSEGKIVILDGCFYFKEQIQYLEENISEKGYIFSLKAPLAVCIERDSKRKRVYGKQAAIEVHALVSKFDHGFIINTEGKTEQQVTEEILLKIKD